jgi:glycine cleavage system H lipoate-binding protein/ABC-type phosphate transport system substrate-binding protein
MKRVIIFLTCLLIVNCGYLAANTSISEFKSVPADTIVVLSTSDLYNISAKWASEYNKLNHGSIISVRSVSDAGMAESLSGKGQLAFISGEGTTVFYKDSFSKLVVGRDVIVPVINSKNPYLSEINQKGISPENLLLYLKSKDSKKWGTLISGTQNTKANFYFVDDLAINEGIAGLTGNSELQIDGIKKENSNELLSAIQNDPYGFGFCKIVNVFDFQNQTLIENISLMPIDRNSNGTLDHNENIYSDFNSFSRGVWIGKYPRSLVSNIYSVSLKQPISETETAFLKWVLNDGQQFLYSSGYSDLLISERTGNTDKLYEAQVNAVVDADNKSVFGTLLIFILCLVLAGILVDFAIRYFKREKTSAAITSSVSSQALDTNGLSVPGGIYFDKTHTWAFMEQNGYVKVGIDDFLQHITGTITRIKMKSEGDKVKKGDQILSIIQNGKQLNLYAPISGIIREKNTLLDTDASIVNSSPYSEGWVYRMEPSNWHREFQLLFMAEKHKEFIKNEFSRMKDFLATALGADKEMYAQVILQDGGELADNTLYNLGPEVWEDFQSKFIDPSRQVWFHELF